MRLRSLPRTVVPALIVIALLPPATHAATSGGAEAPSGEGGTSQNTPTGRVQRRPVARTFRATPKRLREGKLPRIAVRIDQKGVKRVSVRIALVRVGHQKASATIRIKRARTGKLLRPRWPTGTRLREGRYVLRVHAKDSNGNTLRRTDGASGKVTISVSAKPKPERRPQAKPRPQPFVLAPAPGGVFPVQGPHSYGSDGARFGAKRRGHTHEGQDIIAERGTPVVAPVGGSINTTDYQKDGAGYYVVLDGVDDRSYFFAHCRKDTVVVKTGQGVSAGQRLCDVGNTGDSSGPHLHFEIWVGGWRRDKKSRPIDPLEQLRAWDRR